MTKETRLDLAVLTILAIGAGCGLVYEYLLSHYAGRVLGAMEAAIFGIISVMMVFMGIGSFLVRGVKNPYAAFAWLEIALALVGSTSVLLIGGLFALSGLFPKILMDTFGLTADLAPSGGLIATLQEIARVSPYLVGALLGTLIGMEIPLICQIRSEIHNKDLRNNAGSVYGIDYIGAGVGAILWLAVMLAMDVSLAGALTASANLAVGILFFVLFKNQVHARGPLLAAHVLTAIIIVQVYDKGTDWSARMEDLLYRDEVVLRLNTRHQRLVVTERIMDPAKPKVLTFYLNGRTQFASNDEHIYHAMLTYPALAASARHKKILVVGGGDGLAVRDILRWNPEQVMLLDLDEALVRLFREPMREPVDNRRLLAVNQGSFSDPRIEFRFGDAFLSVDDLLHNEALFDAVIVDLPDPSHPDLNKLYSSRFYAKLHGLLAGDGAMVVQSTSPFHARTTFISIGKTIQYAGFANVDQYHANVPSFGEWGWTIATKNGKPAPQRLAELQTLPVDDGWTTKGLLLAAFEFEQGFYDSWDSIDVNRLGTMVAYRYHFNDWQREMGIYQMTKEIDSDR
jgi:spermidine synthase